MSCSLSVYNQSKMGDLPAVSVKPKQETTSVVDHLWSTFIVDMATCNSPGSLFWIVNSCEKNQRQSSMELAVEAPVLQDIHSPQSQFLQSANCESLCSNIIQFGVANETMTVTVVIRTQTMAVIIMQVPIVNS